MMILTIHNEKNILICWYLQKKKFLVKKSEQNRRKKPKLSKTDETYSCCLLIKLKKKY